MIPKTILPKTWLLTLAVTVLLPLAVQIAKAQTSTADSVKTMLVYFQKNIKDSTVQAKANVAITLLQKNSINDTLGTTLVELEDYLFKTNLAERKAILRYYEPVVRLIGLNPQMDWNILVAGLNSLANLYTLEGLYGVVPSLYEKALLVTKNAVGENDSNYAEILVNEGLFYNDIGKHDIALAKLSKGVDLEGKTMGQQNTIFATGLNSLGVLYDYSGEYLKADSLYKLSLAIVKKTAGEQSVDCSSVMTNLAALYRKTGLYDKALHYSLLSNEIDTKIMAEDYGDVAIGLRNTARIYEAMGVYDKSLPLFTQALALMAKDPGKESTYYATLLSDLGYLYDEMGLGGEALILCTQAKDIRKRILGVSHHDYAKSLNDIANLYKERNQYDTALLWYKNSLSVEKAVYGKKGPLYATCLQNMGNLYVNMRQPDKALPLLEEARDIKKEVLGADHVEYTHSLNSLADYYKETRFYQKALQILTESLAIQKRILGEGNPEYAKTLQNLGIMYTLLNSQKNAVACINKANNIQFENIVRDNSTLSEQEKMALVDAQSQNFDLLPSIFYANKLADTGITNRLYNNALILKGMLLQDQQNMQRLISNSGDSVARQLYDRWRLNKQVLGKLLLLPKNKQPNNIDSLAEATAELERELSRSSADFNKQRLNQSVAAANLQENLLPGQAAIEFIRFRLFNKKWTDSVMYAALLTKPGDSTRFVPLFEEKQLQALLTNKYGSDYSGLKIQQLYPGLGGPAKVKAIAPDPLYALIWQPLEKQLAGAKTIYYAPAGLLNRVAFRAMRADTGHLLIDKYRLNQVLSTRLVVFPENTGTKKLSADVWANIQYNYQIDSSNLPATPNRQDNAKASFNFYTADTKASRGNALNALPGTKQEMENIKDIFQTAGLSTTIDSGAFATEQKFKAMDGNSPQLLHLATHGFFLPVADGKAAGMQEAYMVKNTFSMQRNPMFRSGLVLAGGKNAWVGDTTPPGREDGILTAYEISQLDLSRTDLVVLSACESALGDINASQGVIGLQRAFKIAGVKQIVMSLWQVPDKETVELMTLFYKNWLGGQPVGEALRDAQLTMKEKYPPFYWAGFIALE